MPNIKTVSFDVAAEEAERNEDENLLLVDLKERNGKRLEAAMLIREPTEGNFARLTRAMGRHSSIIDMVPALQNFLERVIVEPEDAVKYDELKGRKDLVGLEWLWDLVEDRELDFDVADMLTLVTNFMEEFTGFPTRSSSGSTSSQRSPGTSSTAASRRKGSTRSRSTPAGSQA